MSKRSLIVTLAAGALVLPACAGTDAGTGGSGPAGGTLRVAMAEEPGVLDPHAFTGNFLLLDMIFEPLVAYGEDGTLEPRLAESWSVSADGLEVVFELRDDVTFHDGEPFDADAVAWNFDRWVGGEDYSFLRASQVIEDVSATGPSTVTLSLSEPYQPLLRELSVVRPVRFLSPTSTDAGGTFAEPVGTGPWRYGSSSTTGAVLTRNDDYWGETPVLDEVEFSVLPDSQSRAAALRSGEVDLLGGAYLAPLSPTEAASLSDDDEIAVVTGEPDTTLLLAFNPEGPAADRDVRAAVSLALDRDSLLDVLFAGLGTRADTLFPPTIPHAGTGADLPYDPAAAAASLDAAGWEDSGGTRSRDGEPLTLELLVSTEVHGLPNTRASAEAIGAALGEVGIDVPIRPVDPAAYHDGLAQGDYDLAFLVTLGAPYDPSATAESYLMGETGGHGQIWATPQLRDLVDRALLAQDDDERAGAYQGIYDLLEAEVAYIPLVHQPRVWAVGPDVSDYAAPVTEYDLDLTGVTVDR